MRVVSEKTELGIRAKQREMFVLKVLYENKEVFYDADLYPNVYDKDEKEFVPFSEIERQSCDNQLCETSQPRRIPFIYTLFSIAEDLSDYGLVILQRDDGHSRCKITEKGKAFFEQEKRISNPIRSSNV